MVQSSSVDVSLLTAHRGAPGKLADDVIRAFIASRKVKRVSADVRPTSAQTLFEIDKALYGYGKDEQLL